MATVRKTPGPPCFPIVLQQNLVSMLRFETFKKQQFRVSDLYYGSKDQIHAPPPPPALAKLLFETQEKALHVTTGGKRASIPRAASGFTSPSAETGSCSRAWSQNTQKRDIFRQAHLEQARPLRCSAGLREVGELRLPWVARVPVPSLQLTRSPPGRGTVAPLPPCALGALGALCAHACACVTQSVLWAGDAGPQRDPPACAGLRGAAGRQTCLLIIGANVT